MKIHESRSGRRMAGRAVRRISLLGLGLLAGIGAGLAAQGDLDPGFGSAGNGRVFDSFGSAAPLALAAIVQADGKTVVAGSARGTGQMFVARYNSDGSNDTSFSSDGVTAIGFSTGPGAGYALLQQPDGKLVITGTGQSNRAGDYDVVIVRLNADGSADSTFGTNGVGTLKDGGFDEFGAAIIRQADGKLLVAGASNAGRGYDFDFVRFNADGSVDTSFGTAGRLLVDFGGNDDQANAMVQQSDGAIVATGFARDSNGFSSVAVVRLSAAGVLDTSFGSGGKVTIPFGTSQSTAAGVAQQSDGKLVIVGAVAESTTSTDAALLRLNTNGTLDSSFGTAGKLSVAFGGKDFLSSIVLEPGGKIVAAGRMQRTSPLLSDGLVARFTTAGALDATFGIDGKSQIDCGDLTAVSSCTAYAVARQTDGKLMVVGYDDVQTRMFVSRLLASGGYTGNVGFIKGSEAVAESAGTLPIVVRRTGGRSGAVSVNFTVTPLTAQQGSDITFANGTLNWADGDTADKTINIGIVNDNLVEFAENFTVALSGATGGAGITTSQYVGSITDDDTATNGALQFTSTTGSVNEAAGNATISVGRAGGTSGAVSVTYATSNGTATSGSDYTATTGTLNWADGDNALKSISVPITNDTDAERDETLTITLSAPTGGAIVGPNAALTLTIVDNDGPGTLSTAVTAASVLESVGNLTVNVSRTVGSKGAVSVDYATAPGTASTGSDFTATSGTLNWADGESADKTITIPIIDDTLPEGAETFTLNLSNPGGGAILGSNRSVTVTITANDTPGTLQFAATALSVAEDVGNAVLTVNRSAGANGPATIQYQTAGNSATATSDFTTTTGTLSWADGDFAGKTISVPIINDTTTEGDETFTVTLLNPTGSAALDANNVATVTILANDAASGSGTGGGGKSGCFIATAAFGTPMSAEVMALRHFRDGFLVKTGWGRSFVNFYYAHSPPVADFIRDRDWLRSVVRIALRPLIWIANRVNESDEPTAPGTRRAAAATPAAMPPQRKFMI